MEEAKPAESTATQVLPTPLRSAEVVYPPPSSLPPKTKKRPLENDALFSNSSTLYRVRSVLKEVRPHFEVLQTPDFGTCKPSEEIQEYVKLLMELCKQMTAETVSATRSKNAPAEKPQDTRTFGKPSENKFPSRVASEKQRGEDGQTQGTYIVERQISIFTGDMDGTIIWTSDQTSARDINLKQLQCVESQMQTQTKVSHLLPCFFPLQIQLQKRLLTIDSDPQKLDIPLPL